MPPEADDGTNFLLAARIHFGEDYTEIREALKDPSPVVRTRTELAL